MLENNQTSCEATAVGHSSLVRTQSRSAGRTSRCMTRVEPVRICQYWKIENASLLLNLSVPGNCMRGNIFRESNNSDAFWQLCLYPAGKRLENANHVSLFLKMSAVCPSKEVQLKVEYRFYFLNDKEMPIFSNVNIGEFHAKPPKGGHSWGLRNIPRQKVLSCLHPDKSLLIYCQIELISDISKIKCLTRNCISLTRKTVICSDHSKRLEKALDCGVESDCMLHCTDELIPVNKSLLSIHSEVFSAMFSHSSMVENQENRVVIKDADTLSLKMMLKYIYCGQVDLEDNAHEVLRLADRYQVDGLKLLCEENMCSKVNKSNVMEYLQFGDLYDCKWLKLAAVGTLRLYKQEIMKDPSWQLFKEANPKLIADIMDDLLVGDCESPPSKRRCEYPTESDIDLGPFMTSSP